MFAHELKEGLHSFNAAETDEEEMAVLKEYARIFGANPYIADSFINYLYNYNRPVVGQDETTETPELDTLEEWLLLIGGVKDGALGVFGDNSKILLCNDAIISTRGIFYNNWVALFQDEDGVTIAEDSADYPLSADNSEATYQTMANYTGEVLQWPYEITYNCYWALDELFTPYNEKEFPVFLLDTEENDYYRPLKYGEHILQNLLFNIGYQIQNVIWFGGHDYDTVQALRDTQDHLGEATGDGIIEDVEEYWYQYGYVIGDTIMRIFYRSLYDAPVV